MNTTAITMRDPFRLGAGVRYDGQRLSFVVCCEGHKWRVTIPVEIAHMAMDQGLESMGMGEPATVGERATCNGLLTRADRVGRRHKRRGFKGLKKIGRGIARAAKKAIKSKVIGGLVAASAMVCPAVGGPALAALTAAKLAVKVAEQAKKGHAGAKKAMGQIARNARVLQQSRDPRARLAVAALRSA